jgi:hypothetical protein
MTDRPRSFVTAPQCELLRQALADAVYYRDPPMQCDACEAVDGLCEGCAARLAQASAYLGLSRELGLEASA